MLKRILDSTRGEKRLETSELKNNQLLELRNVSS